MKSMTKAIALVVLCAACSPERGASDGGAVVVDAAVLGDAAGGGGGRPLEGFGAATVGGAGGTGCAVTSLADSGPGTLRDCVSGSNRNITFVVGGDIELATSIRLDGVDHISIDGSTAPPPGITITAGAAGVENALVIVTGGSHDLIVRHIRFRDSTDVSTGDTFRLYDSSHDIVVDHCSFRRGADGAFDISRGVHDVTLQWSIVAETVKNQLISYDVRNVSLHHNLYVGGAERNPQIDTTVGADLVNNVIYGWGTNYGTRIRDASTANLVNNTYQPGPASDEEDAVLIDTATGAQVFSTGNVLPAAADASGNLGERTPAPPVLELSADDAFDAVLAEAGAWPRDADDEAYVAEVAATR